MSHLLALLSLKCQHWKKVIFFHCSKQEHFFSFYITSEWQECSQWMEGCQLTYLKYSDRIITEGDHQTGESPKKGHGSKR